MECNNKLKINEFVSITQLKRKLKGYLLDQGYSEFKPSIFSQGLVISLVMILEELVSDCLKNVTKDKSGLYTINTLVLKNQLYETDKYCFCLKYLRKYNSVIKYHDSVFFNIKKVMDNLETKHGSKLMIDSESKNMICYMILGLQYDITDLALKMVKYSNRKTLNNQVLEIICSYLLSDELASRIKLKLDSYNISNDDDTDEEEGVEKDGAEEVGEVEEVEEVEEVGKIDGVEEVEEVEVEKVKVAEAEVEVEVEEVKVKSDPEPEELKMSHNKIEKENEDIELKQTKTKSKSKLNKIKN